MSYRNILLGLAFVLLGGCADFLTIDPQDELSRDETLGNIRGLRTAVVGVYTLLGDGDYYQQEMIALPEMTGNLEPNPSSSSTPLTERGTVVRTYLEPYAFSVDAAYANSSLENFYRTGYEVLYQISDILSAIPQLTDGTEAERQSLRGEALSLRAIVHFDLVRAFAQAPGFSADGSHPGIVLIEARPEVFDQPARASIAEVYELIVADLTAATDLIDPVLSRRSPGAIWLTPTVTRGLLARVEAYRQNWLAVIEQCDALLATTNIPLTTTDQYLDEWQALNLRETLFEIDLQRYISPTASSLSSLGDLFGVGRDEPILRVTDDLLELYAASDIRRELYTANEDGDVLSEKYPFDPSLIRNAPVLRLSEIYLLRAEAYAATGQEAAARADYDRIHQRAVPDAPPTTLAGAELLAEIRRERRRELALEGHHHFDLSRWGADVERQDCFNFVDRCNLSYPDNRYILPIPLEAILRNPALQQNPGY